MIELVEDRVAVVPLENADKTAGGLWIPEMAKDRLNQGFVKYVGPACVDAKVGQYVLFSGYTGTLVHVQNEGKLIIMPETFIVAELLMGDEELKEIPGVYFRSPIDRADQFRELMLIMRNTLPGLEDEQYVNICNELGKRGVCGPEAQPYFVGNYEMIMEHVARAFSADETFRKRIKVINQRPRESDYEYMTSMKRRPEGVPSL